MKLLKLEELLNEDKCIISKCKKRKTYDWIYLTTLLRHLNKDYSIVDTVSIKNTKKQYDLINIENLVTYNKNFKDKYINKDVSERVIKYYIKKLFPNVEVKTIIRQYKYTPEIKKTYIGLRSK